MEISSAPLPPNRRRGPIRGPRLLAGSLAFLLAGCVAPQWFVRAQERTRRTVAASYAETWDAALLAAQQLGYSLIGADRERGILRMRATHPGARVRDYAAGSERYFGAAWHALDVELTVRVVPHAVPVGPDGGSKATQIRARAGLEATGLLMARRGGLVRVPFASSGALERHYLETLPMALEVTRKRAGAGDRAAPQTP